MTKKVKIEEIKLKFEENKGLVLYCIPEEIPVINLIHIFSKAIQNLADEMNEAYKKINDDRKPRNRTKKRS